MGRVIGLVIPETKEAKQGAAQAAPVATSEPKKAEPKKSKGTK